MEERELLTIPKAAERIGMTRAVLWRHVKAGRLPHVKIGPYKLVDAAVLDEWAKVKREPGRPPRPAPPAR
jgi:excisionase family DNA binding protein